MKARIWVYAALHDLSFDIMETFIARESWPLSGSNCLAAPVLR